MLNNNNKKKLHSPDSASPMTIPNLLMQSKYSTSPILISKKNHKLKLSNNNYLEKKDKEMINFDEKLEDNLYIKTTSSNCFVSNDGK